MFSTFYTKNIKKIIIFGFLISIFISTIFSYEVYLNTDMSFFRIISYEIVFILFLFLMLYLLYLGAGKQEDSVNELAKFKMAVDHATDQIIITDPKGIIIYANNALKKTNGFTPEESIGKKAGGSDLWGGLMPKDFYKDMWQTIKIDKKTFSGEVVNRNKEGKEYFASASITPVLDKRGEIIFFVGIERNITKEKEIDKAKSEFVSLASHQLRTPLSAIRWYSEMLIGGDAGEITKKQKDYLNEIDNANHRMISMVNSLLNVSRLELGTFKIEPVELDIIEEAKKILVEMNILAKNNKVKLNTNFDGDLPKIKADRDLLIIIFQNLLSNAIKYSSDKKDGEVYFNLKKDQNFIIIEVQDNGCGIPNNQKDKIFSKMFRANNVVGTNVGGTGLGLYIIKAIIDKTGGDISFESKEGEGTKFIVRIPLTGMIGQDASSKLI